MRMDAACLRNAWALYRKNMNKDSEGAAKEVLQRFFLLLQYGNSHVTIKKIQKEILLSFLMAIRQNFKYSIKFIAAVLLFVLLFYYNIDNIKGFSLS